jgi:hypothetical protein
VHDGANTTGVAASGDHAKVTGLELDRVHDFASGDVQPDDVVSLNDGIGVADSPAVRGEQEGHVLGAGTDLANTTQLVLGLLVGNPVDGESSLDIIDESEIFSGLFDLDDIHETSWELGIGPQLSVDLDQPLLKDGLDLLGGQGVLEPIPEEQGDWHRLLHLVGAGPGSD